MRQIIFLTLTLACAISCRESDLSEKGDFSVSIDMRILNDDRISVYFMADTMEGYSEEKKVLMQVQRSAKTQQVEFSLPELPGKFRIDLGEVGNEEEVIIEKITLQFNKKKVSVAQNVLHRFFKENIYTERTPQGYKRRAVGNRYDPFIESTALLHKKMALTYKYN